MAQTQDGKKRIFVHPYEKADKTEVRTHYRTPPCPAPVKKPVAKAK